MFWPNTHVSKSGKEYLREVPGEIVKIHQSSVMVWARIPYQNRIGSMNVVAEYYPLNPENLKVT